MWIDYFMYTYIDIDLIVLCFIDYIVIVIDTTLVVLLSIK